MKLLILLFTIFVIFSTSIYSEINCVSKKELPELDSLLVNGKLDELKNKIYSKFEVKHDTNFLNYQTKFFKNALHKVDLLLNTITEFDESGENVQNNINTNFQNNRDNYADTSLGIFANNMYKKCIEKDSIIYCFIAQYFAQRKVDIFNMKNSITSPNENEYYKNSLLELNIIHNCLFNGKPNEAYIKLDSLISSNEIILQRYRNKHICLKRGFKKYLFFLNTIDEYSNYNDTLKLKSSNQIKSKEILYSIDIAGDQAHEQFNLFKRSDPFVNNSLFYFLLAKMYRAEYINKQKNKMRNQLKEILNLQSEKQYDEALSNLAKSRKNLPVISVYKYFSDSLRYQYNKLEVAIKEQRYKDSFWISKEKLFKNYQLLLGLGIQYNPALMNLYWHFLSDKNSNSYVIPVYKLRESFGVQYNGEFAFHLTPELLAGFQLNYGNIYIIKAILSDSYEISNLNKQDTERINSYVINIIESSIYGKYYLRTSPGLMPYLKIAIGATKFWRNSLSIMELFNINDIDDDEKDLYLVEKEASEIYVSPEFGVDFLKSSDSSWIISIYLQTTFMSGGMNQMLGHVRGSAGIKIGKYWQ